MLNRAVTFTKHHTPNSVRVVARRALSEAHNARMRVTVPVVARSEFANVYHCAVRKTASQWVKALLSDPVVYQHSGLLPYDPRPYKWQHPQAFPTGRAVSTLFFSRRRFDAIEKPAAHRAFFVMRDPRDVIVSSYFSSRNSHTPMGDVSEVRAVLQAKQKKDGLLYLIDHLTKKHTFSAMRSWATAPPSPEVALFRYEDLVGERQPAEMARLLEHCGIVLPPAEFDALLEKYSFSNMRGDHYRKGKAGDWRNHFDDEIYAAFTAATKDLVEVLGYPPRDETARKETVPDETAAAKELAQRS